MALQLSSFAAPQHVIPPTDVEKMKAEVEKIDQFMKAITLKTAKDETYKKLKNSVTVLNEIILSLDNSNDFFKIGGFRLLVPLLSLPHNETVAVSAELIADLCQNNKFCQSKALEINLLPELVKLLQSTDTCVKSKGLYAISCLCRSNEDAMTKLEKTDIVPALMNLLQDPDARVRTKAAFFLSHLSHYDRYRDALYNADLVGVLVKCLKEEDSSSENVLSALREQVFKHVQSRIQCANKEYNLRDTLLSKIQLYDAKGEYKESKEHCERILTLCFPDEKCNS